MNNRLDGKAELEKARARIPLATGAVKPDFTAADPQNRTPDEWTNEDLDPKGEAGSKKCPLHLIPPVAMEHTAWAHKHGAEKYGPYNWRKSKVCVTTYVAAIMRHLNAFRDGENDDPESGLPHLAHIGASVNILLDAQTCGTAVDDRSIKPL